MNMVINALYSLESSSEHSIILYQCKIHLRIYFYNRIRRKMRLYITSQQSVIYRGGLWIIIMRSQAFCYSLLKQLFTSGSVRVWFQYCSLIRDWEAGQWFSDNNMNHTLSHVGVDYSAEAMTVNYNFSTICSNKLYICIYIYFLI